MPWIDQLDDASLHWMQDVLATQQQRLADYARQHAPTPAPPGSPMSSSAPHLTTGHAHSYMEGTQRGSMELGLDVSFVKPLNIK